MTQTYAVCGVPISMASLDDTLGMVTKAAVERRPLQVHLCNAYTLSLVRQDERLRAALGASDLNLADGTPVAWLRPRGASRSGPRRQARAVRGSELMQAALCAPSAHGLKHYLYGGAPGVAEEVAGARSPAETSAPIVGRESPPYTPLLPVDVAELADRINASGANVVWVGLGTPKQDYLVPQLAPLVRCPVLPVGAAFDFLAGRVSEAPPFLRGTGLEWLYRLWQEPKRLWRRYLVGNPRFLMHAWSARRGQTR